MRVIRLLSGVLLATLVSLAFFGCSTGGGGGNPDIDPGTADISDSSKTVIYAQAQSFTPDYIYAKFDSTNPVTHPSLASVPLRAVEGGVWTLNFAEGSNDFNDMSPGSYIGDYDVSVYGVFPNQTTPIMIGYRTRVTMSIVISNGGDGPPLPPFWP